MKTKFFISISIFNFIVFSIFAQDFPKNIKIEVEHPEEENIDVLPEPYIVQPRLRIDSCETTKDPQYCSQKTMLEFIYSNIKFPHGNCVGIVVINFVIDETGEIQNENIIKSLCDSYDTEAMRVFQKMKETFGKWVPGTMNGKNVRTKLNLPIRFK